MLHQVVSHPQILHYRYAKLCQMLPGSHAGQHEQFGRVESAAGNNHLLPRKHGTFVTIFDELDAFRLFGDRVYDDLNNPAVLDDMQVCPVDDGLQIGLAGRHTSPVLDRALNNGEPYLRVRVVIVDSRVAQLFRRLQEDVAQLGLIRGVFYVEETVRVVVDRVGVEFRDVYPLELLEIFEDVVKAPSGVAE